MESPARNEPIESTALADNLAEQHSYSLQDLISKSKQNYMSQSNCKNFNEKLLMHFDQLTLLSQITKICKEDEIRQSFIEDAICEIVECLILLPQPQLSRYMTNLSKLSKDFDYHHLNDLSNLSTRILEITRDFSGIEKSEDGDQDGRLEIIFTALNELSNETGLQTTTLNKLSFCNFLNFNIQ